jgi:hypothetical protein
MRGWAEMSTLSCLMRLLGGNMDDTLSKHTEAEVRIGPLEDVRAAFGSDVLALIEGHDADADMRQRNREFVSSNKHGKSWKLVSSIPQPSISPLVLPPPLQP